MPDLATALKNAINNVNTNKEKQMKDQAQTTHSDAKANLNSIINEWDQDKTADAGQHKAVKHVFQPTNNVSRTTFELVKANPGIKYKQLCDLAEARGYKRTSAGSIVTQLVRVGMVSRDETGGMRVTQLEYTPVKYSVLRKEQKKAKREAAKQKRSDQSVAKPSTRPYVKSGKFAKKEGIAALGAQAGGIIEVNQTPASHPIATPAITQSFDADQLLSTLSFNQAIALYKKLKAMLGEI